MTVTKADLIRQIYQSHPTLTKIRSTQAVETFLNLAKDCRSRKKPRERRSALRNLLNSHYVASELLTFYEAIKDSLIAGNALLLSGFGKFKIKDKRLRHGRNPQTGEALMLTARRVVIFKPSGKLRCRVN